MNYEDERYKLLKELRKLQNPETVDFEYEEDCDEDCDDSATEYVVTEDINEIIEKLKEYHVSDTSVDTCLDFIRFYRNKKKITAYVETFYNILIQTDDSDSAEELAYYLGKEAGLSSTVNFKFDNFRRGVPVCFSSKLIIVQNIPMRPEVDYNTANTKKMGRDEASRDEYDSNWRIITSIKQPVIAIADKTVCKNIQSFSPEIYSRLLSHHVYLNPYSMEDCIELTLKEIKRMNSNVVLTKDFEKQLIGYIKDVYPTSDYKGTKFVAYVVEKVFEQLFVKGGPDFNKLDNRCIPPHNTNYQSPEEIIASLNNMTGLQSVKDAVLGIYKTLMYNASSNNIKGRKKRYHMVFTGNPGTGKTTVARMIADIFYKMGILRTNKLVETRTTDFISPWSGGTGQKTQETINTARGGVLFIDEAYGLAMENDKSSDSLNILIKAMEDYADELIVIMAGYEEEMQHLLEKNKGLKSRIGYTIRFDDYSDEELKSIFKEKCRKNDFEIEPASEYIFEDYIAAEKAQKLSSFGNAREIETLLEKLIAEWSNMNYEKQQLEGEKFKMLPRVITEELFKKVMPEKNRSSIDQLVGLGDIKDSIKAFEQQVKYLKYLKENGIEVPRTFTMHMVFMGNPGTGKTTVAQQIADDLYYIGILKTNKLTVAERKDIVFGEATGRLAENVIEKARGGVLFIDEAYSLIEGGAHAIEVFLTAMEKYKNDTIFIFAGYTENMKAFLNMNPGLQSRIGYTFTFPDYSVKELIEIFQNKIALYGFILRPNAVPAVKKIMEYFHSVRNFGNGRFVEHVIQQVIIKRSSRDYMKDYQRIEAEDIPTVKELIETLPDKNNLYDPDDITRDDLRWTAVHELGHAVVALEVNKDYVPDMISIKGEADSLGRVTMPEKVDYHFTQQDAMNMLMMLLGGRNAERIVFGESDAGCYSDYERAKKLSVSMVNDYAMGKIGETKAIDFMREADEESMGILRQYKAFIESYSKKLVKRGAVTGEQLKKEFDKYVNRKKPKS